MLQSSHIENFVDVSHKSELTDCIARIEAIPGQHSGLSFDYFRVLAGSDDNVKPDRHLCRFVTCALKLESREAPKALSETLVMRASEMLGVKARLLDYAIWDYQRGRA